ncbi:MAG: dTDP-4-dehydrorhamnose 3,5-epimerase family protein [Candidatus Omnitrophica bacterium]|nr:dTDP-4-dehydrorhamnose 3,5-epimerase family protein [Candidatus Omnitrophota bacterium]
MSDKVVFIKGSVVVDDRGQLLFCNDFDMAKIRRFYIVSNHSARFIRAWHGHKKERKFVFVLSGTALVAAVKIDNWKHPSKGLLVHRHVLSDQKPGILAIPPGYVNGFMTLEPDTKVLFFSTSTLEETKGDDYRYDARYWNPWEIVER